MNAVNHMAQSESKEYAITNHKKETHVRKKKSCLEKCLISYKKSFRKENKKIIHSNHESCTASLGNISRKHTHTTKAHIHCSSYRTTHTKIDTCIHIVYGCLTKSFVEKNKNQKIKH